MIRCPDDSQLLEGVVNGMVPKSHQTGVTGDCAFVVPGFAGRIVYSNHSQVSMLSTCAGEVLLSSDWCEFYEDSCFV